jgi:hypothetical protein
MRTIHKAGAALLLTALIAAPGAASASPRTQGSSRSFVGTVRGTHAFVGVVVRGSQVIAYVCDSKKIAQWFKGSVRAGQATLTSKAGYVLQLTIGSRQVTGWVRSPGPSGALHHLSAKRASKPAGLYRGEKTVAGKHYLGGWIILPDGRQRGEVLSGSTDVGSPPLDPNDPTVDIKRGKKKPLIVIIAILIG